MASYDEWKLASPPVCDDDCRTCPDNGFCMDFTNDEGDRADEAYDREEDR